MQLHSQILSISFILLTLLVSTVSIAETSLHAVEYSTTISISDGEQDIGDRIVCAKIYRSRHGNTMISFGVYPTPPGEVLDSGPVPAISNKIGDLSFTFIDGWENHGKGTFRISGGNATLDLEMTRRSKNAAHNIGAQYGTYVLEDKPCSVASN